MNRFMDAIAQSKLDGTFVRLLNRFDLVILDDFGLQSMDQNTRIALLQMLEDRYERKSTIIISQLPVAQWYEYIAEPTLADAICDRLLNNTTQSESMRRKRENSLSSQSKITDLESGFHADLNSGFHSSATPGSLLSATGGFLCALYSYYVSCMVECYYIKIRSQGLFYTLRPKLLYQDIP